MLKKVSSVFVLTAALVAATALAQEGVNRDAQPPRAITANKVAVGQPAKLDVVDTAIEAGSFKTLACSNKPNSLKP